MNDPTEWTQAKTREVLTQIRNRYSVGDSLSVEDQALYEQILERHPNAVQKRGDGISKIRVVVNRCGHEAFTITRLDGTEAVAGMAGILRKRVWSLREQLTRACRAAIEPSRLAYKRAHPKDRCALCGKRTAHMHVDHAPPNTFKVIEQGWYDSSLTEATLEPEHFHQDPHAPLRFAEEGVAADFREYHDVRARLRTLCRSCNLSGSSD